MNQRDGRTALLAAIVSIGVGHSAAAQTPPLKLGFLASFSGPVAALAQDQYDAFMLAVEQRGGKLGGVPVQVLKEDDQFKPEVAVQLVNKLIDRHQVPIITGITGSNVITAVAKPIAERQVFLVSTNSGPSPLAGGGCAPFQYVVSFQADTLGEAVGQYATNRGYRRMVLMAPNYVGGKDLVSGFKRYFKGTVVEELYTPLNQLDFSAELTQVASTRPDAVFAFYPGALGVGFMRQYQQAGLTKSVPLLTTGTLDALSLAALKESAIGAFAGFIWGPDLDNPSSRRFVEAFESRYKRIPSATAAQAYDGALLLDSAIAKVKGNLSDKTAFAAALKSSNFPSVRGNFRFNNNNFPVQDFHMFEVAKDSKGRVSMKKVATPLKDHQDPFHAECPLP